MKRTIYLSTVLSLLVSSLAMADGATVKENIAKRIAARQECATELSRQSHPKGVYSQMRTIRQRQMQTCLTQKGFPAGFARHRAKLTAKR